MNGPIPTHLRFNFGFLLDAISGTKRKVELDYPKLMLDEVTLAPLEGEFIASRNTRGIYVAGDLHSAVVASCSRCLNQVTVPTTLTLDALFYYPPASAPAGEPVADKSGTVDLGPLVRELSLLEVPMQLLCRESCQGLCNSCGADLNEGACDCENDDIDPRLAVLKQLLEQDNDS